VSEQPRAKRPQPKPTEQPRSRQTPADKPREAWHPAPWENHEAEAIAAMMQGRANPDQQRTAMKWILDGACNLYDLSYRPGPGGERDTAFAEGRRFVGQQVLKLAKINTDAFRKR
jgi:hypothetical protein